VLGVVLFRRTAKGLELTPEAEAGLPALRDAFLQLEESVRAMQAGQSSKTLTIAAPRDFTAKWLAPRLAAYAKNDGELRFVLIAADSDLDFTEANLDLAIRLGDGPGENEGVRLAEGAMVTVSAAGAPDLPIGWPGCPIDEAIPSTAVFDRRIRSNRFIEVSVIIVGVPCRVGRLKQNFGLTAVGADDKKDVAGSAIIRPHCSGEVNA